MTGHPTGHDVVSALDAATSGPTYRAGVLRQAAIERMADLEREHEVESVAYEMLGPPRLSKLLFEAAILSRLFENIEEVANADPDETAERAEQVVRAGTDLRIRILSIGLPILLAGGDRIMRGPTVRVPPGRDQAGTDPRLPDNGWVDLRPSNWRKWCTRAAKMVEERGGAGADHGSRRDLDTGDTNAIRPGRMAAWVFRVEDRGARMKR
jgi:hypothetical protein